MFIKFFVVVEGLVYSFVWLLKFGFESGLNEYIVGVCDILCVEFLRFGVLFNVIELGGVICLECEEYVGLFLA